MEAVAYEFNWTLEQERPAAIQEKLWQGTEICLTSKDLLPELKLWQWVEMFPHQNHKQFSLNLSSLPMKIFF